VVTFNTKEDGLRTVFKDYQEEALKYLWSLEDESASSRDVWVNVNKILSIDPSKRSSVSRASVINFLNDMVDEDILGYREVTGKGGHRRIYHARHDEEGFKEFIAMNIISKLMDTWPDATRKAVDRIIKLPS